MATDTPELERDIVHEEVERERTGEHSHAHQHYGGLVEHHPEQPHEGGGFPTEGDRQTWANTEYGMAPHRHAHSHPPAPMRFG